MVFNSYTFVIFFTIVLLLHNLPFSWRGKKINLLWASYLFYAAWNPPFVFLLWLSTLTDWHVAQRIHLSRTKTMRRVWLGVSLAVNLGILGYFKYGEFLLASFIDLLAVLGIQYQAPGLDIVLPIGISFYTFQTLSYSMDIYRNRMKPWNSFLDFAMFVTFFPQLVAGPIVRAAEFLPQCIKPKSVTSSQLGWGLSLMIIGLFEKNVLADAVLSKSVEAVYDDPATLVNTYDAWIATLAFSAQIFCDFAGYSTIAIGSAMCLGFHLPDNFHFPYAAIGFSDFWRRWHISLSSWLRDYLYISLGGNRLGILRTHGNLMLTMLLGGLWHGASWNFVVWGGIHGFYLVLERLLRGLLPPIRLFTTPPVKWFLGILTFTMVCFTWVFFRADSLPHALQIASAMLLFGPDVTLSLSMIKADLNVLVTMGLILSIHWFLRNTSLEAVAERTPWWIRGIVLAGMLVILIATPSEDRAFIYFQF